MSNIDLSFCIPTYNRAQSVHRLVTDILSCVDNSIEVVVLDNGSTDETLESLALIKDARLVVCSNGENKGALFNMVNVIDKARGIYLVYSTDQDHVEVDEIIKFKNFLKNNQNISCGYCEFDSISPVKSELFAKGYAAVNNIAYKSRHPTGYFMKNSILKSLNHTSRLADYDVVDLFPIEFIFAEMCMIGDGAIYHPTIFKPERGSAVVKHKSSTTNGNNMDKAFFSPRSRNKLAVNYTLHAFTLALTAKEKITLAGDIFLRGLVDATLSYKRVMSNQALCTHYYMEPKYLKAPDLLKLAYEFNQRYVEKTASVLKNSLMTNMKFKFHVLLGVLKKIFKKIA